ncbi:hypothetical protein N0V83_004561 [Neocucurbitaria cava]|uniref:Uncharacterized protein n=1 Tax=Neocucurbitaria cava TaxID=798079 RepID=A0A9W8Y9Z4_9PLEO|nr:hypothetical protein N0V83_004561 [Neocucurbitaria cava]
MSSFERKISLVGRAWEDKQVQEVYRECAPTEWWDRYTNSKRVVPTTFNPFFPSVEAIDPFTCRLAPGGTLQTWVHAVPNLGMVPNSLNLAKGIHLLSSLAEIGSNCALSIGASSDEKQRLDEQLMDRLAEQRVIAMKYGVAKKQHINASFTPAEYQAARQEFRSGRLGSGDSADRDTILRQFQKIFYSKYECAWNDEQKNNLSSICA